MKRKFIIVILILISFLFIEKFFVYNVREDIYTSVKKYHIALIKDVENLKKNEFKENELGDDIHAFINFYEGGRLTKEERELIKLLDYEYGEYLNMQILKLHGKNDLLSESFSEFQQRSSKLDKKIFK